MTISISERFGVDATARIVEIPDFDRAGLAALFADLGYRRGVEVGTEIGLYAETLCIANPDLHLTCVDPWLAYRGYREHTSQAKLDGFCAAAERRLRPYRATIIREPSPHAARWFPDRSIDFVYIDGNHEYGHVVADIAAWRPKVRPGGIVAGHDWIRRKDPAYLMHVVDAVTGYANAYRIAPLFVVGAKAEVPGQARDDPRSWFWVEDPR